MFTYFRLKFQDIYFASQWSDKGVLSVLGWYHGLWNVANERTAVKCCPSAVCGAFGFLEKGQMIAVQGNLSLRKTFAGNLFPYFPFRSKVSPHLYFTVVLSPTKVLSLLDSTPLQSVNPWPSGQTANDGVFPTPTPIVKMAKSAFSHFYPAKHVESAIYVFAEVLSFMLI